MTNAGCSFTYTITGGGQQTKAYWAAYTSASTPAATDIRSAIGAGCVGGCSGYAVYASAAQQSATVSCVLLPSIAYKVWLVMDSDGLAANLIGSSPTSQNVNTPAATVALGAVTTPTTGGFSFTYTVSGGGTGAKVYWMATINTATPTPANVRTTTGVVSTCSGNANWVDGASKPVTVTCVLQYSVTYKLW